MASKITAKQLHSDVLDYYYGLAFIKQEFISEYQQMLTVSTTYVFLKDGSILSKFNKQNLKLIQIWDENSNIVGIATVHNYDEDNDTFDIFCLKYGQGKQLIDDTAASDDTTYSSNRIDAIADSATTRFRKVSNLITERVVGNTQILQISDISNFDLRVDDFIYDTNDILARVQSIDEDNNELVVEVIIAKQDVTTLAGLLFEENHNYTRSDIIINANHQYICTEDYTSSSSFADDLSAGKWRIVEMVLYGGEIS